MQRQLAKLERNQIFVVAFVEQRLGEEKHEVRIFVLLLASCDPELFKRIALVDSCDERLPPVLVLQLESEVARGVSEFQVLINVIDRQLNGSADCPSEIRLVRLRPERVLLNHLHDRSRAPFNSQKLVANNFLVLFYF